MIGSKGFQTAQIVMATIMVVAALSVASSVFAPVAFALFIIALMRPLQKRLQAILPRLIALAISVVVMVTAFLAFGSLMGWAFAGSALSMSPALVLFSVFFWSYPWGIFGAFIGVPATIAILTFCAAHPSSLWLAELFGSPSRDGPAVIHQPVAS